MNNFEQISDSQNMAQRDRFRRVSQRDLLPQVVKPAQIAQDAIQNTTTTEVNFSIGNGVTISLNSRTVSSSNSQTRLGTTPFMVAFFEAASSSAIIPGTNRIPNDVATGRYTITTLAMPNYTYGGERFYISNGSPLYFATDGNDVVYSTSISNNSGSSQNLTALIQSRIIQTRGGGA